MRKVGVLTARVTPDLEALGISLAAAWQSGSRYWGSWVAVSRRATKRCWQSLPT